MTNALPTAAALLGGAGFTKPKTRDEILQEWLDKKAVLDSAKAEEMTAREAVVAALGFDPNKKEGTERVELANGYELKAVKGLRYTLKNGAGETDKALDKLEASGPEGKFIAERLVKWKPDVSVKEWRELPEQFKTFFNDAMTISEAAVSLELIEPKAKK